MAIVGRVTVASLRRLLSSPNPNHFHLHPHPYTNCYSSYFAELAPYFSSNSYLCAGFTASLATTIHGVSYAAAEPISGRRPASCCLSQKRLSSSSTSPNTETITVTFVDKDGDEKTIKVPLGISMLEAAHQNDIELEGACEGSLACSTCHVIVMDEKYYSKLPEATDEENDMLDLAFGLTETSRLGCQVIAKPELDGMRLAIPSATRNFAVDGYVPKPH